MTLEFYRKARLWLTGRLGESCGCPSCGRDDWHVSDPTYPIIQFRCRSCGHILRTDLASIEEAGH
jgi:predicted  nucleic acid-binding Zn ribbon protein